jgi:hydrogenase maturation protease
MCRTHQLFVGIGSSHGDDQAGWLVADRLGLVTGRTTDLIVKRAVVPTDILDWLEGIEHLHLCDACRTESPPGTLHRWEWPITNKAVSIEGKRSLALEAIESAHHSGSHDWQIPQTLQLAERLGILPPRVTIWGIEGRVFEPTQAPILQIQASLSTFVDKIVARLCLEMLNST